MSQQHEHCYCVEVTETYCCQCVAEGTERTPEKLEAELAELKAEHQCCLDGDAAWAQKFKEQNGRLIERAEAAEARCTALQQQLDEVRSDFASFSEHHAATEQSWDATKRELADFRGSITRLIAQWRSRAKDSGFDDPEFSTGLKVAYERCANVLEAALTPQGEK